MRLGNSFISAADSLARAVGIVDPDNDRLLFLEDNQHAFFLDKKFAFQKHSDDVVRLCTYFVLDLGYVVLLMIETKTETPLNLQTYSTISKDKNRQHMHCACYCACYCACSCACSCGCYCACTVLLYGLDCATCTSSTLSRLNVFRISR